MFFYHFCLMIEGSGFGSGSATLPKSHHIYLFLRVPRIAWSLHHPFFYLVGVGCVARAVIEKITDFWICALCGKVRQDGIS
jgi:hypothetical protein